MVVGFRKTILSHFMFSSRFMLFSNFLEKKFSGGGGGEVSTKIVVLVSEPVGGRSRVTELPCYLSITLFIARNKYSYFKIYSG